MIVGIILLFLFSIFFSGCGNHPPPDPRLVAIEELISHSPQEALDSLVSINCHRLSDPDRHYYDFLLIKSKERAFIEHTSDSLILRVIGYEENNKHFGRYTEALYYAGRVYHDMGDFLTALNYYHTALDKFGETGKDVTLKGNILWQTARVFTTLRLYDRAIPYVERTIECNVANQDSIKLMYATELLANIYLQKQEYILSTNNIKKAKKLGALISPSDTSRHNVYLGALKYNAEDIDSALYFIHSSLRDSILFSNAMTLSYAGLIYRKAEMPDSALLFANKLLNMTGSTNRKYGYGLMFSPELKKFVSPDSLRIHLNEFWDEMERSILINGNQEALIQNSFYNYYIHESKMLPAQADNRRLYCVLGGSVFLLLIMGIFLLLSRNRHESQLLEMPQTIGYVSMLCDSLEKRELIEGFQPINLQECFLVGNAVKMENMQADMREKILALRQTGVPSKSVPYAILDSEAYHQLCEYVRTNRILTENNPLWSKLEEVVLKSYPNLKKRINILAGGKIKPTDFHLVLLIKCGISSTNISCLVDRAKSTIVYRKDVLGLKLFDKKMELNVVDDIIHLL